MSTATHIASDTYRGRWYRRITPGTHRVDTFTAAELAAMFTGEFAIWESGGYTRDGRELFCRIRVVPQADGSLYGYDADGARKIIHPAKRAIRILTQ